MMVEHKGGKAPQLGGDPMVRVALRGGGWRDARPVSEWRWPWMLGSAAGFDIVGYELTDGWKVHNPYGSVGSPVAGNTTVEYCCRDGTSGEAPAWLLSWGPLLGVGGAEIVRYRVFEEKPLEKAGLSDSQEALTFGPLPQHLPESASERKGLPIYSGVVKYFPDALVEVAKLSRIGNDQHNPGKPLFWDRSKSGDELDALSRHLLDAGTRDTDGVRHSAKVAWRALANLQKEIEKERSRADSTR